MLDFLPKTSMEFDGFFGVDDGFDMDLAYQNSMVMLLWMIVIEMAWEGIQFIGKRLGGWRDKMQG